MKIPPVLLELITRFATDNPKFFKWIQIVSGLIAVVAFIPDMFAFLEIPSPSWLEVLHDKAIKAGALTAIIIAQFPNKEPKK